MAAWAQSQRGDHPIRADMDWSSESGEFTARGAARTIIRTSAGLHACAVAEPDPTRCTTKAVGAVAATAVTGGAAGAAIRGATPSTTQLLPRRTLTLTRRAEVGLSRNGAGRFGEVGSAPRGRGTREARPLPFCALAYTFRLFWSISTEEALTEFGAATPTALGGPSHPWEGGQGAPYEGSTHQPDRLTA